VFLTQVGGRQNLLHACSIQDAKTAEDRILIEDFCQDLPILQTKPFGDDSIVRSDLSADDVLGKIIQIRQSQEELMVCSFSLPGWFFVSFPISSVRKSKRIVLFLKEMKISQFSYTMLCGPV